MKSVALHCASTSNPSVPELALRRVEADLRPLALVRAAQPLQHEAVEQELGGEKERKRKSN